MDPKRWHVSEKFYCIRPGWEGCRLWTRGGDAEQAAKKSGAALLPGVPLDREIWVRGESIETKAKRTVRCSGKSWTDEVCFVVLDVPGVSGSKSKRIRTARRIRRPRLVQVVRSIVCRCGGICATSWTASWPSTVKGR